MPVSKRGETVRRCRAAIASSEFVNRLLSQMRRGLREQVATIAPRLLEHEPASLGYFEVLANSTNIMQDHITRSRLAGDPPHVMLAPRLRHVSLMEFNRAKEAIAEGRLYVEQPMPVIRCFIS